MNTTRLTTGAYWESGYAALGDSDALQIDGFRNRYARQLVELIESLGLNGRRILEVGAGNSAVLSHLARKHGHDSEFSGLDYSETGCLLLARRAEREGARVLVLLQDLFEPMPSLLGQFDVVYSLGVVEHFSSLSGVLQAKRRFMAPAGRMLTVIPNMAGILGALTRRYNREVYALHVPHNLGSLVKGHAEAGLDIEAAGYLCSTNFGVLSSCFHDHSSRGWSVYVWLSRVTKALWFLEEKFGELPHTARLSPYLYVVSRTGK